MIEQITKILIFIGIFHIIDEIWKIIDTVQFGAPMPSCADAVAALILAVFFTEKLYELKQSDEQDNLKEK